MVAALFTACSRPNGTSEKSTGNGNQPAQGDWAIVRVELEPESLNPLTANSSVATIAMWGARNSQVYELLMGYNNTDFDVTEPLLAEGPPTVSADHLTYTINIRDGVKW